MTATVSYEAAQAASALEQWEAFIANKNRWRLTVQGPDGPIVYPAGTDFDFSSPFGSFKSAVVTNPDGTPNHDKGIAYEAPATNVVAWGLDDDASVCIGIIHQPRPHADDPTKSQTEHQGEQNLAMIFGQIPMGYLDKLAGGRFQTPEEGATAEVSQETGASTILKIERPLCPWQNPNPTFVGSWTDLLFVQVDLKKIEELKFDHNEPIYKAEYIRVPELLRRIAAGRHEGVYYRMGISNAVLMTFFATHPEFFAA